MDGIFEKTNFFLESYTPGGLRSFFDEFYSPEAVGRVYHIAGANGSVASMVVRLVADNVEQRGYCVQSVSNPLCSHQVDAVYFPQLNTCISNGGERGVLNSKYPVATDEVVSLCDCFDREILQENADKIKRMYDEYEHFKKKSVGFMTAAQALMNDSREIAYRYVNADKVFRYASRLARREFPLKDGRQGRESRCFLSSITARGVETHTRTLSNLCDRFFIFNDRYGAVSGMVIEILKTYALANGYDVIACYCALSGGVEHLVVPELKVCFFSDCAYHSADFIDRRKINYNRFTDVESLNEHKKRLSFNRKGIREMLNEAVKFLEECENIRKRLDFIYFSCLDKSRLMAVADNITEQILK